MDEMNVNIEELKGMIKKLAVKVAINSADFTEMIDNEYLDELTNEEMLTTVAFLTFLVESQERMMININEACTLAPDVANNPKEYEKQVRGAVMAKLNETVMALKDIQGALAQNLEHDDGINAIIDESIEPLNQAISYLKNNDDLGNAKMAN